MSDLDLNKKYYKWNIKSGDYTPEIDEGYKKYKKNKNTKQLFALFAIVILISSIIILFITN